MARLWCIAPEHPVLDIFEGVVLACYLIEEGSLTACLQKILEAAEHSAISICLLAFRDHFEEHMNVHTLVDV